MLVHLIATGLISTAPAAQPEGPVAGKQETMPVGVVKEIRRLKRGLNTGFELVVENAPLSGIDGRTNKWVLYFDGLPIQNMSPSIPIASAMSPRDGSIVRTGPLTVFQFEFSHDAANQTWRQLFAQAGFARKSAITVGPVTGSVEIVPEFVAFKTLMIPGLRIGLAAAFYGALVGLGVCLARRTKLLKEDGGRGKDVFSLGRTQMGFWFFLVLGAYLFIGVMTGTWVGTIGTQALALMGISATTGIAAAAISSEKRQQVVSAPAQVDVLGAQQIVLQAAIANPSNTDNVPVLMEQLKAAGTERAQLLARRAPSFPITLKGLGFWRDLVSDADGIALHRFQVIVWTMVLGAIFLIRVATDLVMPELDPTTLALMGISSGTYLGFKFPEKA